MRKGLLFLFAVIALWALPWHQCSAELAPDEVLVIYNSSFPNSGEIAGYYADKRGVPAGNILRLALPSTEDIDRKTYNQFAMHVRSFLKKNRLEQKIRCVLLIHGVPLRISAENKPQIKKELSLVEEELKNVKKSLNGLGNSDIPNTRNILDARIKNLETRRNALRHGLTTGASVDSELSLLFWPRYNLEGWVINPLFHAFIKHPPSRPYPKVLMVARLDGPDANIATRLLFDALWAEKQEKLSGTVYLDARGLKGKGAYAVYDESIRLTEQLFREKTDLPVVLDDKADLFPEKSAPDALFYCGWYSVKKYIPAFTWERGSVGYHISSFEAASLRKGEYWCKRMLDEGITATIGAVDEPYINSFPLPSEFFYFLLSGENTLVEAYYLSMRFLSWKLVLVGDPLYKPFRKRTGLLPSEIELTF